ncbi:hypothetical protein XAC9322_1040009 [Xanthomonas citri pv. citri]|nr:hypothetical protein XAC9322_1040009 [Xanthomonas citri pv. citri]
MCQHLGSKGFPVRVMSSSDRRQIRPLRTVGDAGNSRPLSIAINQPDALTQARLGCGQLQCQRSLTDSPLSTTYSNNH